MIGAVPLGCAPDDRSGQPDDRSGQLERDNELEWRWSKEKAKLAYCIKQHLQDYDAELLPRNDFDGLLEIRTKGTRRLVCSLDRAFDCTVFTRWKDTLFIASYCPIMTGCEVLAVNLKTGKELWKSSLEGIGGPAHSKYLNLVNIETDGQRITVFGNEVHGRYVEQLDIKTGKTLVNKRLDADPTSLFK